MKRTKLHSHWHALPVDQQWVTVLLDIDEVLCVAQPQAASTVLRAFDAGTALDPLLMKELLSPAAKETLSFVHQQLGGPVRFAISSNWRQSFARAQIEVVMKQAGLGFVGDGLQAGDAWCCSPKTGWHNRELSVLAWLEKLAVYWHPLRGAYLDASVGPGHL